ncbi:DUF4232 domain-containing protein [Streptomyces montanus]|uniref:DUF4232 domain-containing protein n=1 Tax=Streptomyces montanus TaxID=2580423 RepID=A0A5R9FSC3_9ACTN|nr:DUF4232 domain-containing protein [Streptomyces montanus]TLS46882.1 DUF4232 domain-containing protein [Streptomyces montanus]
MSARTHRTRMLGAAAITVATLTLAACNNGEGVRDEGASAGSTSTSSPTADGGTSTGAGQARPADSASKGSASKGRTGGAAGSSGTTGSSGSSGTTGSSGSNDSASVHTACSSTSTRMTATVVSRPLNHLLLTVTNTGSKNCDLTDYPAVQFDEAQSVPPAFEDSKPQAVVTLAPGESGYASVRLAAADGSGSNGFTAKSLTVYVGKGASAAHPSLPAKGVYVDDSIGVSYWQSTMADALTW